MRASIVLALDPYQADSYGGDDSAAGEHGVSLEERGMGAEVSALFWSFLSCPPFSPIENAPFGCGLNLTRIGSTKVRSPSPRSGGAG